MSESENTLGRKDDKGKVRMDLIPPETLFALAAVLEFGARKYADRNWEAGMDWGRVFGAMMRHMWAWWGGKGPTTQSFLFGSIDGETQFSHLWHALACLAFLVSYEERGVGKDTRLGAVQADVDYAPRPARAMPVVLDKHATHPPRCKTCCDHKTSCNRGDCPSNKVNLTVG